MRFSAEAQAVLGAGKELWRYYHTNAEPYNPGASLDDIKAYFQGRDEKGRMNSRSEDENYNTLIASLR